MIALLCTGLALALIIMTTAVIALIVDGRRIERLERTVDVAGRAIEQLTAERDEARRALDKVLAAESQRGGYLYVRPAPPKRRIDPRHPGPPGEAPTEQFDRIVERNIWPGNEGRPS